MTALNKLKNFLPWVVGGGIFYYLFTQYPLARLLSVIPYMHIVTFVSYSTAYFIFMWLADCWSLSCLFSRMGYLTKTRELLALRLASYPVMILNYGVGQGALAYFFKKKKGMPFLRSTSLISFTSLIDVYWIITLAFVGSIFSGFVVDQFNLKKTLWLLWGGATLGMILMMVLPRIIFSIKRFEWLTSLHIFAAFREARFFDYLYAMVLRSPLHLSVGTTLFFIAPTFGVEVSFLKVITYLPIALLIGTIPITPGGLGTFQIAMVAFFKDSIHGPLLSQGVVTASELIFLMTLAFQLFNYLLKIITGTLSFKKAFFRPVFSTSAL